MSPAFDAAADALAAAAGLTLTQARGTLRLALKRVGVDPRIALRADLSEAVPHLEEVVAGYRIHLEARHMHAIRVAIDGAEETSEDALDFFKGID
jgi:hypothetical protein